TELRVVEQVVAVSVATAPLRAAVERALRGRGVVVRSFEAVRGAAPVSCDGGGGGGARLVAIRKAARPDAAVIVVLGSTSGETVAQAHQAGAFACVRPPFVAEELASLVASALDSRAAKVQV